MKSILKKLGFGLLIFFLIVFIYGWLNYAPDRSFESLKAKWSYDNSQFIEIDGMPVHYRINGTGAPLVLLHGTGASLHTWEAWTNILAKDFKVISLDLPAYGLTGAHSDGNYSLDFYAQFLNTFLGKIQIDHFSLAGNSLGAGIAWKYASLFPEKLNKLVLIDALGYPQDKPEPLVFRLAKNKIFSKFLLTVTPKSLFFKSMKEVYHDDSLVTDELINRYYELYLRTGNRQAFLDRVNSIDAIDTSKIASIKTPTLILWGKTDEWILLENAYKFKRDLKASKLIIYEESGHVPMEEIPEKSAKDTRDFLLDPNNSSTSQNVYTSIFGKEIHLASPSPKMLKQFEIAQQKFNQHPDQVDPAIWYGRRAAYLGRYEDAIKIYSNAIEKFPKDPRLYRHRGHRYISIRKFDLAIQDLQKASQLIEGKKNEIEPDGLPNAMNIPISTLHGNIWYHLGLAYYLKHDYQNALKAYLNCRKAGTNADNIVSSTHWLYMIQKRLGKDSEAKQMLKPIQKDLKIIENIQYYKLCKFYKELIPIDSLQATNQTAASDALRYGLANWYFYQQNREKSQKMMEEILNGSSWNSFGYIAAESDYLKYFK